MAVTRCDLYKLAKRVISALNAGTASVFSTVIADGRRSAGEIFAAIQAADDQVCKARAKTLGDGYRSLFLSTSADLDHGDTLPDRLGDPEQVVIKYVSTDAIYHAGKFDKDVSLADIERWRANAGGMYGTNHNAANSLLSGFYRIEGDQIFFTGHRAQVKVATYTRTSRNITDAAMTASSKNLTSATAAFTSADVGAGVLVGGVGVEGLALISRIESVTNGTTAVLADAASTTASAQAATVAKLQAPECDEDTVLGLSLANLPKEGDSGVTAPIAIEAKNHLGEIKQSALPEPPLQITQAA